MVWINKNKINDLLSFNEFKSELDEKLNIFVGTNKNYFFKISLCDFGFCKEK